MHKIKIIDISLTKAGFVLFLAEKEEGPVLPVIIGISEAHSITLALNDIEPERPLSHDLFKTIMDMNECSIIKVIVNRLEDKTFYADVYMKTNDGVHVIDSRPSDAIALAIRYKAPIYITDEVMKKGGDFPSQPILGDKFDTDKIEDFNEIQHLESQLTEAISREFYEDAALLRDKINKLKEETHN